MRKEIGITNQKNEQNIKFSHDIFLDIGFLMGIIFIVFEYIFESLSYIKVNNCISILFEKAKNNNKKNICYCKLDKY